VTPTSYHEDKCWPSQGFPFFILVILDHIESIDMLILSKGDDDDVMGFFLSMLKYQISNALKSLQIPQPYPPKFHTLKPPSSSTRNYQAVHPDIVVANPSTLEPRRPSHRTTKLSSKPSVALSELLKPLAWNFQSG
jgi:hypothetical protein